MTNVTSTLKSLTDDQLLDCVETLAYHERQSTAELIAGLVELEARGLHLAQGYSSLFAYCTQALRLSEDAAYNRIRAVRVAAKWPEVLGMISDGSLGVTVVRCLSDVLTDSNHAEVLAAAAHKSKREVELLVATLNPRPDAPASIRHVSPLAKPTTEANRTATSLSDSIPARSATEPADAPPSASTTEAKASKIAPVAAEHYRIQFTMQKDTHDKFRRVQDLMRHANPKGDPAIIFDRALTVLLERLEKTKLARTTRPSKRPRPTRSGSRHIPWAVRREVWARDRGRCAFIGSAGCCAETGFLEYHHVVPYADGGAADVANIQLRCRAHNAFESEQRFGPLLARERQPLYEFS
jgi:hypothetical protein